jgi:hypothetical protein
MNRWELVGAIAGPALLVSACMSASMGTGLTQLSSDTYRLSRIDGVGRYPDAAAMTAAVIEEADAFARTKGKVAVPLSTHQETMRAGHLSTVEYEFRLAALGEPAAKPAAATPDTTVNADPKGTGGATAAAPTPVAAQAPPVAKAAEVPVAAAVVQAPRASAPEAKPDLYNELIMLDDLRKRGILTDAEFQALKTKLLAEK